MPVSVHELTEYISWASDDYLHLALSDGTDGKITKANIVSGLTGADALDVYYVKRSNNLSDIASPALARANLNLGSVALLNQITKANIVDFSEADYATAVQGLLAESALQPGDNISELVNDAGYIPSSQKGVANGVASLDINGKIPELQIPAIAISNTFVVESEAEQLALDAQVGDVAIRNDEGRSYILQGTDPSNLADWQELKTPTGGVGSVNGQTGTVILTADDIDDTGTIHKFVTSAQLTKIDSVETGAQVNTVNSVAGKTGNVTLVSADVGLPNVDNTSDIDKPISTATQAALDGKQDTITGAATTITGSNLTASRALVSDASGKVAASSVTSSEIAHLSGVTSGIQEQINSKANSSVNLVAGTGLTGGGNLTADRTFAVTYGTSAGTAAQGNDPRLSDAREWTASTITQEEAETGTATTRRAWTAQRVRQAIVAWWNGSADKTKLDGIAAGAEVNQNAFTTISVAGQGDVVADTKTDTLTLVGGTGVNIFTDPVTDTITFEATGTGIEEVIAGNGLTGGGGTSTVTLNVGAGTGITVGATTVGLDITNTRNVDHSAVSITAGTGLTGGGDLTATRTLSVSYGTTAGTAAQGNDPRLSDSREWTADTVTQADAEAGTSTTRTAWTAQRVRQAIAAWWNTVGTTVGQAILNLANPSATRFIRINADNTVTARTAAEMRTDLGLGTAATFDASTPAKRWVVVPVTGVDGGTEIGRWLDFHGRDNNTGDSYDYRIGVTGPTNPDLQFINDAGDTKMVLTNNGRLRTDTGTMAAPVLSHITDTDTGLYYPTDDEIALVTGGSDRLRIGSSGNIGIGTIPTDAKLDVRTSDDMEVLNVVNSSSGTVNEPLMSIQTPSTTDATMFRIRTNSVTRLTMTGLGNIHGAAGTAINPSYSMLGDEDTGLYFPATDTAAISTGGVNRLNISTTAITSSLPINGASATEMGYLSGVTSAIQTQLNAKASKDVATTSADGLMSSADKIKLNGIAAGAEVNQNAFTTIAVSGQSDVVADSKTDTLTLVAGTGIAITTNAATDAITIEATGLTQNVRNASYTLEISDKGKHIYHSDGTARTYTVPPNSSVAFPIGTTITIVNDASSSGGTITLAQGSGVTIIDSNTGSSGSKTMDRYGMATLLKVGTDRWYVSGSGYYTT